MFDRLRGGTGQDGGDGDDGDSDDDPRVVFLGLDGVPYDLVVDHPDVFENLHRIAEGGTLSRLSSVVPPESSACWPCLTTGVNPGKTGVYGFQDRAVGSDETYIPTGKDVRADRVWDHVTRAGKAATVLNVPVTFPPQRDVQRMVSGFLSPSIRDASSDPAVADVLDRYGYAIDVDTSLGHGDDTDAFLENARETLEARYRTFDHYLAEDDWDLFFGVFMTTDRVNHFLFGDYANDRPETEGFLEFYRTLDRYVGRLYDRLDDDTTLVIASDHGFTDLVYEVSCNEWLARQGYLTYGTDDPDGIGDLGDETEVYSLIPGRFFVDVDGAAAYEAVRSRLIADLEALTGPDGSPVCATVYKGEEVFDGPTTDIAPDVVVVPEDGFDLKSGFGRKDAVFTSGPRNGMHKFSNACLITDDDRIVADGADLYDIAPTLLDLLDVPRGTVTFDGASLLERRGTDRR
ncbi:nucleotide pyrophosphatase [Halorubrum sp. JWXQ-INN 858]|nr:nucleotide pyrophosphatase [Halorubrum sp. JWXQ-INN 858]